MSQVARRKRRLLSTEMILSFEIDDKSPCNIGSRNETFQYYIFKCGKKVDGILIFQ